MVCQSFLFSNLRRSSWVSAPARTGKCFCVPVVPLPLDMAQCLSLSPEGKKRSIDTLVDGDKRLQCLKSKWLVPNNPCCSRRAVILLSPEFICVIQHRVSDSLEKMNHVSLGSHCLIETLQTNPFCVHCDPSWGHSGHHSNIFSM